MEEVLRNKKQEFNKWLDQRKNQKMKNFNLSENGVDIALLNIGIKSASFFMENDPKKIRLYVSELVLKREHCKIENVDEYLAVIQRLLLYAEYLETSAKEKSESTIFSERNKINDSLLFAYYLSRLNKEGLEKMNYRSFKQAFDDLARLVDQKASTIKNMRDEFDPYFDNGRAGWYQRDMSPSRKYVFDMYAKITDDKLTKLVLGVREYYYSLIKKNNSKPHKKLKVESTEMKEIRGLRKQG